MAAVAGQSSHEFQSRLKRLSKTECAALTQGAAILHLHAYDDAGRPTEDPDIYSTIIDGLKSKTSAIVYPTLALSGTVEERFAPVEILAKRGLLEWCVVDPGSVNITHTRQVPAGQNGFLYANPDAHIRKGLEIAAQYKSHPSFAVYEPGFVRLGAAWSRQYENLPQPIYRVMLSEDLLFGLPPRDYALEAYQALLKDFAPTAPWMVSGLGGDVSTILGILPQKRGSYSGRARRRQFWI